jgi:hypothetical protein
MCVPSKVHCSHLEFVVLKKYSSRILGKIIWHRQMVIYVKWKKKKKQEPSVEHPIVIWGSLSPETELVIGLGEQISPQSIGLDVLWQVSRRQRPTDLYTET